jgi:transcriptional regulator with XRE-family HTH domain
MNGISMIEEIAPSVGARNRAIREQHKLSPSALAERSNLSVNAIRLIERAENSPTVSSLHLLATALVVKITNFFENPKPHAVVLVRRDQRLATQAERIISHAPRFQKKEFTGMSAKDHANDLQKIEPSRHS